MMILLTCLAALQGAADKPTPELLRDLSHKDPVRRKEAFEALKTKGSTAMARTLKTQSVRWLRTAGRERERVVKALRTEHLKKLNPAHVEATRKKILGLLDRGDTKAMRPLVEAFWKEYFIDFSKAGGDEKYADAVGRIEEIDGWLRELGDTESDVAGKMAALFRNIDDAEQMRLLSKRDQAAIRFNQTVIDKLPRVEAEFLTKLNRYRMLIGRPVLKVDTRLCDAARMHSKDMDEHNFFSHESPLPGKRSVGDRAKIHKTSANSENIYRGSDKAESAFWTWFLSLGHHQNMVGEATSAGVGNNGRTWTMMTG